MPWIIAMIVFLLITQIGLVIFSWRNAALSIHPRTFAIGPKILPSYCVNSTPYKTISSYIGAQGIKERDRNRL